MSIKRSFDIAVSGVGIVTAATPVICLAAIMSKVTNSSPFFQQERIGKNGKPFKIFKIKTMSDERDQNGQMLPDEQRTSRLGIFLRKTRIDELPQLINVFKGDMSLVGPRPVVTYQAIAKDEKRHTVMPGLTGLSQLEGQNTLSNEEWLRLDHDYVDSHSMFGDLKIILKTPLSLFKHRYASHFGSGQENLRPLESSLS